MAEWTGVEYPEYDETLGDHEVELKSEHLLGKRIALLVTGSVAAMNSPHLARELRKHGADVQAFVSESALKYGVNKEALQWATWPNPVVTELTSASEHLNLWNPFDLYLVAPATANTICKIAAGISDTVVTGAVASALGRMFFRKKTSVMMVPCMHGSLHNLMFHDAVLKLQREHNVFFVKPFNAYGKHNMTDKKDIVMDACRVLSDSPLKNKKILVTSGPTPVMIDSVRMLTNRFSGKLGVMIAEELYRLGADVFLLQSYYGVRPPRYVPHQLFKTYDEYRYQVLCRVENIDEVGVFSAAVADYRPEEVLLGKTPSKGALKNIKLTETEKVIDLVSKCNPNFTIVSFKYEEGKTEAEEKKIVKQRLDRGHELVVYTDGTKNSKSGDQVARIYGNNNGCLCHSEATGKNKIAEELAIMMESSFSKK